MPKWTVRVDDKLADTFRGFCALHGITVQAALEAMVRNLASQVELEDGKSVYDYNLPDDSRERFITMVERARRIDAERRRRD